MSPTPQSSIVSPMVVIESKRVERPAETRLEEALGLELVSHKDLGRHQCVDWLKAHETLFSRARMMETVDLTWIPTRSVMGPINYRPLKLLGSPGLIAEPLNTKTALPESVGTPSRAVEGSRQATGSKRDGAARCCL